MLEGLDHVNWAELEHAYGSAEDVPDLIRDLASKARSKRERALETLWTHIIHQGTVYSATAHAVPFLLELLSSPKIPDKPELLTLVTALANGNSYLDVHQHLLGPGGPANPNVAPEGWDEQLEEELGWVDAARAAVVQGAPVFLRLLEDPDADTRCCAAYALAVCGSRAAEVVPRLTERLAAEDDNRVKMSLLRCLGCVGGEACVPLLDHWLRRRAALGVRASAALALAEVRQERVPAEAVEVLGECLRNPQAADRLYAALPWTGRGSIVSAACQALSWLGPGAALRIADALDSLPRGDSGSVTIVEMLLGMAFQPRRKPLAAKLSELQRSILLRLVRSDRAWDFGNVFLLLHERGLPGGREDLAEFLGASLGGGK